MKTLAFATLAVLAITPAVAQAQTQGGGMDTQAPTGGPSVEGTSGTGTMQAPPKAKPGRSSRGAGMKTEASTITFAAGSATLDDAAKDKLKDVATWLEGNSQRQVYITASGTSPEAESEGSALAARRAQAAESFLEGQLTNGNDDQVKVAGPGEAVPRSGGMNQKVLKVATETQGLNPGAPRRSGEAPDVIGVYRETVVIPLDQSGAGAPATNVSRQTQGTGEVGQVSSPGSEGEQADEEGPRTSDTGTRSLAASTTPMDGADTSDSDGASALAEESSSSGYGPTAQADTGTTGDPDVTVRVYDPYDYEGSSGETMLWRERPSHLLTPAGLGISVGGGITNFINTDTSDVAGLGGLWEARLTYGTRSFVAVEAAYVGSAQPTDVTGLSSDANLIGNGGEANLRINFTRTTVQPYIFGGGGWTHYQLVNDDVNLSGVDSRDDVFFVPAGVGLGIHAGGFLFDIRGTARFAFDEQLVDSAVSGNGDLDSWSASARLGWEL
ncbi:MAG: OmpA family protein [Myxococcales bacterium]|nr:OmpA family protein [Myxococcales bacterium]